MRKIQRRNFVRHPHQTRDATRCEDREESAVRPSRTNTGAFSEVQGNMKVIQKDTERSILNADCYLGINYLLAWKSKSSSYCSGDILNFKMAINRVYKFKQTFKKKRKKMVSKFLSKNMKTILWDNGHNPHEALGHINLYLTRYQLYICAFLPQVKRGLFFVFLNQPHLWRCEKKMKFERKRKCIHLTCRKKRKKKHNLFSCLNINEKRS